MPLLGIIFLAKLALSGIFSSGHIEDLFLPFLNEWLQGNPNPWSSAFEEGNHLAFPYPPLMLWLHGFLPWVLGIESMDGLAGRILLRLPTLLADLATVLLLSNLFPGRKKDIHLFYTCSPILIFACYMHGQLDLIPTSLVFGATILLMRGKYLPCGLLLGAGMLTKLHVLAVIPLFFLFVARQSKTSSALKMLGLCTGLFLAGILPYLKEPGFFELVLFNPRQSLILGSFLAVGQQKIYLALGVGVLLYGRFFLYRRISHELLTDYLGLLFVALLLIADPAPGWFVWFLPFISLFFLQKGQTLSLLRILFYSLEILYLLFFLSAPSEHVILKFFGNPFHLSFPYVDLANIAFTLLWVLLILMTWSLYRFGIQARPESLNSGATFIVGIAGDSGAGKTTLLEDLRTILGNRALHLEEDAYHRWERHDENWNQWTHLHPKANFLHQQTRTLRALKSGLPVFRREYDHSTGAFSPTRKIYPHEYTLISGLHSFYLPGTRKLLDLRIYLDTDEILRAQWKKLRDSKERGKSQEEVEQDLKMRETDSRRFILPQKDFADIILSYQTDSSQNSLNLQLVLSAQIDLEPLLEHLKTSLAETEIEWEFLPDLQGQRLKLLQEPQNPEYLNWALNLMPDFMLNLPQEIRFASGFRGFCQLVFLYVLSESEHA